LPSTLACRVAELLKAGTPVALGFECPLFVPLVEDEQRLTCARPGEGSRAWSAAAGCSVLTTGLVEVAWVLREILRHLGSPTQVFLDWKSFEQAGSGLLIWEAFVSGVDKGADHAENAKVAVDAFKAALPNPETTVTCTSEVYSLVGTALLRTGWSSDLTLLSQPCLVIGPGRVP